MSQTKCPNCSAPLAPDAKFCSECGAPIVGKGPGKTVPKKPAVKKTGRRDFFLILASLVVIVAGYAMIKGFGTSKPQPPAQQPTDSPHAGMDMGSMGASMPDMPTDYEGLVNMGNMTMDQGNYALAAECYRRALAIDGSSPDVRTDFGACLHGMGLAHRAIEEFNKVLEQSPNHQIATFNLGIVYVGMNQPDSARVYLEKYLSKVPTGAQADAARKYLEEMQ